MAPFTALADKYGEDLAVVWIDSHPDVDTPSTAYDGYHAMAVATLTGHGDQGIVSMLPGDNRSGPGRAGRTAFVV